MAVGAVAGDPIGGCNVSPAGYAHMTAMLTPIAPVEVLLEGGYNLRSISLSAEACMRVLLGTCALPHRNPPAPRDTECLRCMAVGTCPAISSIPTHQLGTVENWFGGFDQLHVQTVGVPGC